MKYDNPIQQIIDIKMKKVAGKAQEFERLVRLLLKDVIYRKNNQPLSIDLTLAPSINEIRKYLKQINYPLDKCLNKLFNAAIEIRNGIDHANMIIIKQAVERLGLAPNTAKIVQGYIDIEKNNSLEDFTNIFDKMQEQWQDPKSSINDVKMTGLNDGYAFEYMKNIDAACHGGILDHALDVLSQSIHLIENIRKIIEEQ